MKNNIEWDKVIIIAVIFLFMAIAIICLTIAEVSKGDTIADLDSGTMRLIQLNNRSDLNKDGVINMKDFAIWSADYSESQAIRREQQLKLHPPKPEPNIPEQKVYGCDFNDPCFINFYMEYRR